MDAVQDPQNKEETKKEKSKSLIQKITITPKLWEYLLIAYD
tara:strand:+ start:13333 stop:13455 length:123 start_codon:yes stop_codon:yes gene_type:complete